MFERLLSHFVLLFVVVDPLAVAGVFWTMAGGNSGETYRQMAVKACGLAAGILLVFAFGGDWLLAALGIGVPAFRIAGGLLLLILAVEMVFAHQSGLRSVTPAEQEEAAHKPDITVFPIAFPLIAGPGAITSTMFIAAGSRDQFLEYLGVLLVLGLVMLLTLLALLHASRVMKVLGETGANVIGRIFGLLLAGLAVQFVVDGLGECFPRLIAR